MSQDGPAVLADTANPPCTITDVRASAEAIIDAVGQVIVGQRDTLTLVMVALLTEGHVLLEDVPGTGKTLMAKALTRALSGQFRRIQFTPDLLPSDVTGLNVFDQKSGDFRFVQGPVMANIVLADEINRATPRTQSSLLEVMEEHQVTVDAETRPVPRPFMVLATENPIEQEGTFPLPEAQLDRFLMKLSLGYPSEAEENAIVLRFERENPLDFLEPAVAIERLLLLQSVCRTVHMSEAVRAYLLGLVRATRDHAGLRLGASPRASQRLYLAAQAFAAIQGRDHVLPDDVKTLAGPVLAHRLVPTAEARLSGSDATRVIAELLESQPVPVE